MLKTQYIDAIMRKVFDADFDTVMKSVNFVLTPREHITVKGMEKYYYEVIRDGREGEVYGEN